MAVLQFLCNDIIVSLLVFSVGGKTYRGGELFGQVERDRETRVVQQSPKTSTTQMPRSVGTGKQTHNMADCTIELQWGSEIKTFEDQISNGPVVLRS